MMIPGNVKEFPAAWIVFPVRRQQVDREDTGRRGDLRQAPLRLVGGSLAHLLPIREDHQYERDPLLIQEALHLSEMPTVLFEKVEGPSVIFLLEQMSDVHLLYRRVPAAHP